MGTVLLGEVQSPLGTARCGKSLTTAPIRSWRIRTRPGGLCPFGNKFPIFWQGNILNSLAVSTWKSVRPCQGGHVSCTPCTLQFIWRRKPVLFPTAPAILATSQHSQLKILTKFCYEGHVPSRYITERSVQLFPFSIPMPKATRNYNLTQKGFGMVLHSHCNMGI